MFQIRKCSFSKHVYLFIPLLLLSMSSLATAKACPKTNEIKSILGELGYKNRGEFCEGLYESKISADFELISLLQGTLPPFDLKTVLTLSSQPTNNSLFSDGINITALSVKPRLYYRMDALIGQDSLLKWPLKDVVIQIPLKREDIGIFGWKQEQNKYTYVPIINQLSKQKIDKVSNPQIQIAVRVGVNVEFLTWRVFTEDFTTKENVIDSFHPAGRPISFEFVAPNTTQSTYKIQLDAKAEGDDTWLTKTLSIATPIN